MAMEDGKQLLMTDLRVQEVICQELNLPFINTPSPGATQVQNVSSGTSQAQASASGVPQPQVPNPGFSQMQNGVNSEHVEASGNEAKGTTAGSDTAADIVHGAADTTARSQNFQDLYHFREMQKRLIEFIKKRVLLLEKGLNAELQKDYYADEKPNGVPTDDIGHKVTEKENPCSEGLDTKLIDQLPQVEIISPSEIVAYACDKKQERLDMARLFNEMSNIVKENVADPYHGLASLEVRKNLAPLKGMSEEVNNILALVQQHQDGTSSSMDIDDKAETKNGDLEMEEKQQK